MITEQINQTPVNTRTISMPVAPNSGPKFNLADVIKNTIVSCQDCGNAITGTECIDCTKQTIL